MSCLCHLRSEAEESFINRGDGHHVGCLEPRLSSPSREEASLDVLGLNPLVRMTARGCECEPYVAAAILSHSVKSASRFAEELKETIAKKMPAWRGWGIEYREPLC